jgi:group I intron endonuclease
MLVAKNKKEKRFYVYKIINIINWKLYIGFTTNSATRMRGHIYSANNSKARRYHCYLSRAIRKYGAENFKFEVIREYNSSQEMKAGEIKYIAFFETKNPFYGYNLTDGGDGSIGVIVSDATKEKLSIAVQKRISDGTYQSPNIGNFILTPEKTQDLCIDYKSGKYTRKQLARKYEIGISTVGSVMLK